MTFDEFWKNRPRGIFTDEDYAKMAWDAAIEAAANEADEQDCDQTEYMCRTIERAVSAIRALSSNVAAKAPERSDGRT